MVFPSFRFFSLCFPRGNLWKSPTSTHHPETVNLTLDPNSPMLVLFTDFRAQCRYYLYTGISRVIETLVGNIMILCHLRVPSGSPRFTPVLRTSQPRPHTYPNLAVIHLKEFLGAPKTLNPRTPFEKLLRAPLLGSLSPEGRGRNGAAAGRADDAAQGTSKGVGLRVHRV